MHLMFTRCIKNVLTIRGNTYALYYSFILFRLAIVLPVLLRYTESDCPFGIFKIFLQINFSRFSINGGYWKNKMRSRKILHRCNDPMRGLSPHFYFNISKDMRCHISIHQFKIQNSATIAVFYWHIQCICKDSLIVLQFISPLTLSSLAQDSLMWVNCYITPWHMY
jgi:hypothetical protein